MTNPHGSWFMTGFDVIPPIQPLPIDIHHGFHPAVSVTDHFARAVNFVGRASGESGAVLLRFQPPDGAVRVTTEVALDSHSASLWADRADWRARHRERPRLFSIVSQGLVRTAAVLSQRYGWTRAANASAVLSFDLEPDEVSDGIVTIELRDVADRLPKGIRRKISPASPLGMRLNYVKLQTALPHSQTPLPQFRSAVAKDLFSVVVPPSGTLRFGLLVDAAPLAPVVVKTLRNRHLRTRPAALVTKGLRVAQRSSAALLNSIPVVSPRRPDLIAVSLVDGSPAAVSVTAVQHPKRTITSRRRPRGDDSSQQAQAELEITISADVPGPVLVSSVGSARVALMPLMTRDRLGG